MFRRWFFKSAAVAFVFYGAFVGALFVAQDRILFPVPERHVVIAADFEAVVIGGDHGRRLQALFRAVQQPIGTVIFFHGNGSQAADEQARGRAIAARNYNVLLAEYSGYGGSDGQPSGARLKQDALASYDWVAANTDGPVIMYGSSLGTGLAVHVAARRSVAALVLEAPYDALVEVAQRHYPWVPVRLLFRNDIAPVHEIALLEMPVLIMHGTGDATIPIAHGRALAAAGGPNVSFEIIDGAGHNDLVRAGSLERALAFLDDLF